MFVITGTHQFRQFTLVTLFPTSIENNLNSVVGIVFLCARALPLYCKQLNMSFTLPQKEYPFYRELF